MTHSIKRSASRSEFGMALPTVMVMLLLSSLLALTAWRSMWLNEWLLRSRADAMRTQWAADATLQAALDDVLASHSDATAASPMSLRHNMGSADQDHVFFPKNTQELSVLRQRLGAQMCREGICAPSQPLPSKAMYWQNMLTSAIPLSAQSNASLGKSTHYWIEIFLQNDTHNDPPFVYRITAMATGLKSAQPVVLQAIFMPREANLSANAVSPSGRWISWTVLHD